MKPRTLLYIGCYTHESKVGIRICDVTDPDGAAVTVDEVEGLEHPSFLAAHPSGQVIYAVSEVPENGGGAVLAFRVDPGDGALVLIDRAQSHGSAPCHLSVTPDGRHVVVANYSSGSITVRALDHDGSFGESWSTFGLEGSGPHPRQAAPHAHCAVAGPLPGSLFVADLGSDRVVRFRHDDAAGLEKVDDFLATPGSGPRHLVFHPSRPLAFLVSELDSTLVTIGVEADGGLRRLGTTSTLPDGFGGESLAAGVLVHPNERFVYVTNRGHDSVATFRLLDDDPLPVSCGHVPSGGRSPRSLALHPDESHLYVANQDSDAVTSFGVDGENGDLVEKATIDGLSKPAGLLLLRLDR